MIRFQDAINICELSNIHTHRQRFTWSNNRRGSNFTKERIDRAMSNLKGMDCFPRSSCHILLAIKYDHSSLVISITKAKTTIDKRTFIFMFEVAWKLKEGYVEFINKFLSDSRSTSRSMLAIQTRLQNCKQALMKWQVNAKREEQRAMNSKMMQLSFL